MKVAIIILNWNGRELLEEFLPTVVAHSPEARIYVADNASLDNSVDFIQKRFPGVRLIQLDQNYGYAGGYNRAVAKLDEELLVLLNSDVAVTPGWLAPVVQAFEKDPQLAAACPKILDYQKQQYFEYAGAAGGFIDRLGIPYCRGRIFNSLEKDRGQYDSDQPVFWASGACFFVRRTFFQQVDGLDEDLFAHQEEIDLCWRLQQVGGSIRYLHASRVFHLGGGTLSSANPKKTFLNFRNTLLLLFKNVAGGKAYVRIFVRLLMDGVAAVYFLLSGRPVHALAVLRAHLSFYRLIPRFTRKRRQWASELEYATLTSIVWAYYIQKKRTFKELR